MNFGIKAEVRELRAKEFMFDACKTMYGGKAITKGDTVFVFASENEGGPGLIACRCRHPVQRSRAHSRSSATNSARQHQREAHRGRERSFGRYRVARLFGLERWTPRDRDSALRGRPSSVVRCGYTASLHREFPNTACQGIGSGG
jgi:hypothetical protein